MREKYQNYFDFTENLHGQISMPELNFDRAGGPGIAKHGSK